MQGLRGITQWMKNFLSSLALACSESCLESWLHHLLYGWKWPACQACLLLCKMRGPGGRSQEVSDVVCDVTSPITSSQILQIFSKSTRI